MSVFSLRRVSPFGGSVALWTPAAYPPDFWGKPVDSSLSLSGNSIISLSDYLSNGRVLSAPTTGQRPARVQNGLGVNNTMLFDGSDDILSNATVGALGLTSVLIMAVMRFVTGGATEDLPISIGSANNAGRLRSMYRSSNGTTLGFAGWSADVSSSTHSLDIGGDFHLFGVWNTQLANPNNARLMRNATITTHSTAPSALQATVNGLAVGGAIGSGVYHANIAVAEFVVYYSLPSSDIIDRLMGYLAWEHGQQAKLPAGFIYSNAPPTL